MRARCLGPLLFVVALGCSLDRMGTADPGAGGATPSGGSGGAAGTPGTGGTGGEAGSTGGSSAGGSAGLGGSGGSSGSGGSGGVAGESGSGGGAGTGATGGSAGTAGTGATGGSAGAAGSGATGGSGGTTSTYQPPWWDGSWKSRRPVEVVKPAGSALEPGFQVGLPIPSGTGPGAPSSAWRVVSWDGSSWTDLPRVVEVVGTTTWVWFRTVASIPAGSTDDRYWIYSANPVAPEPPFAADVFEFHAFFDAIDASKWTTEGDVYLGIGSTVLDGNGAGASVRSTKTFPPGHAVDFAMTVDEPLASDGVWFCGGFQRQDDFTNTVPWILWISRSVSHIDTEFYNGGGISWTGSNVGVDQGIEHAYGIERFERKMRYLRDQALFEEFTWGSDFAQPLQIRFSAYNGSVIRVRYARIRRASDPAPTASLGAVEIHP